MSNADRIVAALADLESKVIPNYNAIAKRYGVICTILMKEFKGKTGLNHEVTTEHRQALNPIQENMFLGYIQRLVTCGTPSIPAIVRNVAEEIYGGCLGRYWIT